MQNYDLTDDEQQLAGLVREFADEVVAPRSY
jgi:short-chain 2-methylacyl-CoA dehydrogenase